MKGKATRVLRLGRQVGGGVGEEHFLPEGSKGAEERTLWSRGAI